jgi:HEAT repeat protein
MCGYERIYDSAMFYFDAEAGFIVHYIPHFPLYESAYVEMYSESVKDLVTFVRQIFSRDELIKYITFRDKVAERMVEVNKDALWGIAGKHCKKKDCRYRSICRGYEQEQLSGGRKMAEKVISILIKELKNEDSAMRADAAFALGDLTLALGILGDIDLGMLKDKDSAVTEDAVFAICDMALVLKDRAVPALIEALEDSEPSVRGNAAFALGCIRESAIAAVPRLIEALQRDKSSCVRQHAAEALGYLGAGNRDAISALIAATKDEDGDVRGEAGLALAMAGEQSALPIVIKLLEDPEQWARQRAAEALSIPAFTSSAAVKPLIKALEDENPGVRLFAAQSLGTIGAEAKEALQPLSRLLHDEDKTVREVASQALRLIAESSASDGKKKG